MADDSKSRRRGDEAKAEKNLEDDDREHGGGPQSRRQKLQREVFIDKHYDEDNDPDSHDDMSYAAKELESIRAEERTTSTSSTARTTGTTGTTERSGKGGKTKVEDISDFE